MRYQITIEETVFKRVFVEAESIEEAKAKGLAAAQGLELDRSGRTVVSGFRIADKTSE